MCICFSALIAAHLLTVAYLQNYKISHCSWINNIEGKKRSIKCHHSNPTASIDVIEAISYAISQLPPVIALLSGQRSPFLLPLCVNWIELARCKFITQLHWPVLYFKEWARAKFIQFVSTFLFVSCGGVQADTLVDWFYDK